MKQTSHAKTVKYQKGEINGMLVAVIAAIVIGLAAFMYAHDASERLATQQAALDKLQATVAAQQDMLDKSSNDMLDLQAALQNQGMQLDAANKDLQALKDAERKRIEKAKLAAKPKVVAKPKAKAKAPVKKKK